MTTEDTIVALESFMQEANMTYAQVADATGVSRTTLNKYVSKVRTGQAVPEGKVVQRVREFLSSHSNAITEEEAGVPDEGTDESLYGGFLKELTAQEFQRDGLLIDLRFYRYREWLLGEVIGRLPVEDATVDDIVMVIPCNGYAGIHIGLKGRYFALPMVDMENEGAKYAGMEHVDLYPTTGDVVDQTAWLDNRLLFWLSAVYAAERGEKPEGIDPGVIQHRGEVMYQRQHTGPTIQGMGYDQMHQHPHPRYR